MRATAGIARATVGAFGGTCFAPRASRERNGMTFVSPVFGRRGRSNRRSDRYRGVSVVHDDVVRPDEAPIAAQHVELTLAAAGKGVFGHDEIGRLRVSRARALCERDLVGGARSADRGQIVGQRLDVLLLAERIGAGCTSSAARPDIFLTTLTQSSFVRGTASAHCSVWQLLHWENSTFC